MVKISPSILSADFSKLGAEILDVEQAGADYIHIDVMDGHFVPNITIGPLIVEAIQPITDLPLDVHLMIDNPDTYIPTFVKAGATILSVHEETCKHLHRTIHLIKESGAKAGVVVNPGTPAESLKPVLPYVDLVLVMTVNPGFGGQTFIHEMVDKISQLARYRELFGYQFEIEVDGGVNIETAQTCVAAGADVLVAGSAIFGQKDRKTALQAIRTSATSNDKSTN